MELKLSRKGTIMDLKRQFAKFFPYLKLEFFKQKHDRNEASGPEKKIYDSVHLSEIKSVQNEGVLLFEPTTIVADFEQRLQKEFGLPVQVFRKAGDMWIETIQTDNLSLAKQNLMGQAASKPLRFNLNSLFL